MAETPHPEEQTQRLGDSGRQPLASGVRAHVPDLLHLGDVVNDRFEVHERLGAGSLGAVYRVHDTTMGEARALKVLFPEVMKSERARERFIAQIRLALRMAHPGLVRVHDFSEDRTRGVQFFTMEYVRGVSLDHYVRGRDGTLPLEEVLVIGERMADALAHAHQYTIHRDIKPRNVMITAENEVKLLDFGLAQLMTRAQFSQSALVMGTAYYQAPEISLRNRPVDQRADIYSIGVLLYEMITGHIPQGNFPLPSEVVPGTPRAFNRIVTRCLATAIEDRFATAGELAEALRLVASGDKGGRLGALVQAVRERAAAFAPMWSLLHDAVPEPATAAPEPAAAQPESRFEAPTTALVDENAARRARLAAADAMQAARDAGAEEHAARRFAMARDMLEEADAPCVAGMYGKAIAEYEAAMRAFLAIAKRVEVVKAEKTRLNEVLEAIRKAKADVRVVQAKQRVDPGYVGARDLEVQARKSTTRPEAIALLTQALQAYNAVREAPPEEGAAEPGIEPGIDTSSTPPAEIACTHAGDVEEIAPPRDVDEHAVTRFVPVDSNEAADASDPAPTNPAEQHAGHTRAETHEVDPADGLDMTMPARGLKVTAAQVPPRAHLSDVAPSTPDTESRVLLVPDDYSKIQNAIDAARTGDTVRIRPGIYDEHLVLKNGVKVIGESRKTVIVRAPGGHASVVFAKNCRSGLLSGMTLEHSASHAGDVRYGGVKLHNSSIGVFRCIIQRTAGSGVIVKSGGAPTIRECVIQDNPWPGIYVRGQDTAPLLKGNTILRNGGRGIYFEQGARGRAIENECRENNGSGISIHDAGTNPEIRQNTCTHNSEYGLYFGRGAAGTAEDNACSHNGISGISVHDGGTAPVLKRNACVENNNDGIYFGEGSGGFAEANTCARNREDGIFVRDPNSAPRLVANQCLGNGLRGIEFGFGAHGIAERNRCESNGKEGIRVSNAGTQPKLAGNECVANGTRGIYFSKGAGGVAEGNLCEGNKEIGLAIAHAETAPVVRSNRLLRNGQYGLFIDRDAAPKLDGNEWGHNDIADLFDDRPV